MLCFRWRHSRSVMHHVQGGGKYLSFFFFFMLERQRLISLMQMKAASEMGGGKCYWKADSAVWKMLCDWR